MLGFVNQFYWSVNLCLTFALCLSKWLSVFKLSQSQVPKIALAFFYQCHKFVGTCLVNVLVISAGYIAVGYLLYLLENLSVVNQYKSQTELPNGTQFFSIATTHFSKAL